MSLCAGVDVGTHSTKPVIYDIGCRTVVPDQGVTDTTFCSGPDPRERPIARFATPVFYGIYTPFVGSTRRRRSHGTTQRKTEP